MRKSVLTLALSAPVLLTACHEIRTGVEGFTDKSEVYAQVETSLIGNGTPRRQLTALMGTPVRTEAKSFAGLDGESLVFTDAHSSYHFVLINGRTVTKSQNPKPSLPQTK